MKKGLSVLLGLLMMLSIFTKIPFRVAAKDVDIAETGNPYPTTQDFDGDGHYEIPCTWFAWQQAYDKLGISLNMWGAGNQWFGNAKSEGKYQTGSTPKANSIACWDAGTWGHVSYVTSASGNYFTVNEGGRLDKDTTSSHGVAYDVSFNMTVGQYRDSGLKLQGFIYLDGAPTPKPSNPWINISKTTVPTGGDVSFTFGANDAAGYTIGINKNGSRIITEDVSSGKSYTFNEVGNYTAYVTAWNSAGGVDTNTVSFTVFETINLGNDFVAHITNSKSGMNIGANSVANVELQTKADSDYQKWHFLRQSDNSYKIINIGHDQCLDVANFGTANGTNIGLCPSNETNAQRYYIRDNGSGYGIVPKVNTGAALDISGGSLTNGANIQEYTWNGSNAQMFSIDYVGLEPSVIKEYNGHTYEYYNLTMPWNQAYRFCESKGGHLVTITEQAENEFVCDMINESIWIGLTCYNNNKSWYWVTGEAFSYNNFVSGQPDYNNGIEFYGEMYYGNGYDGQWNDHSLNNPIPFVCEYDNGDVKTDTYTPVLTETIDGITYSVYDDCVDWLTAEAICEAKGGQLVKIDSADKNAIVNQLANKGSKPEYWINVTDRFSEGVWSNNDGTPLTYTNWANGEPTNDFNAEEFAIMYKSSGLWIDIKGFCPAYRNTGFICESKVPTDIKLNAEKINMVKGKAKVLTATVTPEGVDSTVTWRSSNTKVATVTKTGKVTAKNPGFALIYAKTVNGLETYSVVLVADYFEYKLGDCDGSGEVDSVDSTYIQRKVTMLKVPYTDEQMMRGDVDADNDLTIVDATIIQRYSTRVNVAYEVAKTITVNGKAPELSDWSSWSMKEPSGDNIAVTESHYVYRYKDTQIIKALSLPNAPDGYSFVSSEKSGTYTDWSAWSGWNTDRQSADGILKQEDATTGYRYYCFACPNCGQRDPYQGACSKCGYVLNSYHAQITYYPAIGSSIQAGAWDNYRGYVYIEGVMWTFEYPGTDNGAGGYGQPTTTMYRYHTRSEYDNYRFTQDTYSDWQNEEVVASPTREVEKRMVYRYKKVTV